MKDASVTDWHLVPGLVEGNPGILVFDPNAPGARPKYFMLLNWQADKIANFRHAAYVIEGAEYLI
jgi:RNA polymerase sigma-70 factor, ECF subfamily